MKIKTLFLSLIAALGLTACGFGNNTAFVEQTIEAEVKESAVAVVLPKKTEEATTDYKGYLQVKIRDVAVQITPYSLSEETGEEVKGEALESITLHLEEDEKFVSAAYATAFNLLNLESGDGDKLNYKILDKEIGTPFHKGIALKFNIDLGELAKINTYDVLKTATHFTLKVKDVTSSVYAVIHGSRPFAELDILWDGEAFVEKEKEADPVEPAGGDTSDPGDSSEPEAGEGE